MDNAEVHIPESFDVPYDRGLYAYANWVKVQKPGEMVHIDFVQIDVGADAPGHGTVVARVVVTPALAKSLLEQLSTGLEPGTKSQAES